MNVSVVGLGKLGLPLAAVFAAAGHRVEGVDIDPRRVAELARPGAVWAEPGLGELLAEAGGNLVAGTDAGAAAARSEISIVIVSTPSAADGGYDDRYVLDAIAAIGAGLRGRADPHVVVVASTVMPGTMAGPAASRLQESSGRRIGAGLGLCYCPIFAALGDLICGYRTPDFLLIGESDAQAGARVGALYGSIAANHPSVLRMSLVEAEIAKISLNNFIMTKLFFANMLANLCARFPGADVARVTGVLGLDKRIGRQYFRAAMPYGGPCFGRDGPALTALARRLGTRVPLTEATEAVNAGLAADIVTMLQAAALPGARIAILGLAFRHDTDVAALSPTIGIANALHASGRRVRAWDPLAAAPARAMLDPAVEVAADASSCLAGADAVLVANADPAFAAIPAAAWAQGGKRPVVLDCWRILPVEALRGVVDLRYLGVGAAT